MTAVSTKLNIIEACIVLFAIGFLPRASIPLPDAFPKEEKPNTNDPATIRAARMYLRDVTGDRKGA